MAVRGRTSAGRGGQDDTTKARNECDRAWHERNSGAPSPLRIINSNSVQVAMELGAGLSWDYTPKWTGLGNGHGCSPSTLPFIVYQTNAEILHAIRVALQVFRRGCQRPATLSTTRLARCLPLPRRDHTVRAQQLRTDTVAASHTNSKCSCASKKTPDSKQCSPFRNSPDRSTRWNRRKCERGPLRC